MGCIESSQAETPVTAIVSRSGRVKNIRKPSRLSSKFKLSEIKSICDDDRHAGASPCYACPICFLYFNSN